MDVRNNHGFTLPELFIVLGIIVLIPVLIAATYGAFVLLSYGLIWIAHQICPLAVLPLTDWKMSFIVGAVLWIISGICGAASRRK